MNQDTLERLRIAAPSIEKFRRLSPEEQAWLTPLLSAAVVSALGMLDAIEHEPLTFEEIGRITGRNPQTVAKILNVLSEKIGINLTEKSAFAPTGRPRKLARR